MVTPETQKLQERAAALVKQIKAHRERDRELSREVQRALEKLRRLAAA